MKIDVGSGVKVKEGFVGLDKEAYVSSIKYVVDLEKGKLPFKNNEVDEFSCEHVLEHLNYPEKIVSELYRCVKKGGKVHIVCPYFSYNTSHVWCHKNYWSTACAKLFKEELYHETKESFSEMKITLHRPMDSKLAKVLGFPFVWLAKKSPVTYERWFAYVFPMAEIHFDLVK